MQKIKSFIGLTALLLIITAGVSSRRANADQTTQKLEIFGGLGFGYSYLSTNNYTTVQGVQGSLGVLGSYYYHDWVTDVGIGWFINSMSGLLLNNTAEETKVWGTYIELSPRYRLGEHWQFGPAINLEYGASMAFDAYDTNASPKERFMGGLKVAYETKFHEHEIRFTAKPLTDIVTPSQRNYLILEERICLTE